MEPPLREKYVDITRQSLLDTALQLFTGRDYGDVSAEELVRAAGLTRGALYHHFDGKRGLFEAVFNELEEQAAVRIRSAVDSAADPLERIDRGVAEFFEVCADDAYRRIVMVQCRRRRRAGCGSTRPGPRARRSAPAPRP